MMTPTSQELGVVEWNGTKIGAFKSRLFEPLFMATRNVDKNVNKKQQGH